MADPLFDQINSVTMVSLRVLDEPDPCWIDSKRVFEVIAEMDKSGQFPECPDLPTLQIQSSDPLIWPVDANNGKVDWDYKKR